MTVPAKPATLLDVAREAGVSPATVSRTLNHPHLVNPETRDRIERVVNLLGFRPNRAAQGLRNRGYRTLAVFVADIRIAYYAELARAIDDECRIRGYGMLLRNGARSLEQLSEFLDDVPQHGVDGIIIATGLKLDWNEITAAVARLETAGIKVIIAGQRYPEVGYPCVWTDNRAGARMAVEHLLAQGSERIAFVGALADSQIVDERVTGYSQALADAGVAANPEWIVHAPISLDGGAHGWAKLRSRGLLPDAVLAANDEVALGVMRAAGDAGLAVPNDVAIVGFDGLPVGRFVRPSLSSVRIAADEIGQQAVRLFFAVEEDGLRESTVEVPAHLIARESSSRLTPRALEPTRSRP